MLKKQSFDNNIYMKIFQWIYIFLLGNCCFLLVNFPFFLVALTSAIDPRNIWLFLLTTIGFLPSIITMIAWIDKWKEQGELNPVKDYFLLYSKFWKKGFTLGWIGWLGSIIALVDVYVFLHFPKGKWLLPVCFLLLLFSLAIQINNYYFQIRNQTATLSVIFKTSIYFALKKWYISLINSVLIGIIPLMMIMKPQFGFTIVPVLIIGIIYLNCTKLYKFTFE